MTSYHKYLHRIRVARDLSGREVARRLGCHPNTPLQLERRPRAPWRGDKLDALCAALSATSSERQQLHTLSDAWHTANQTPPTPRTKRRLLEMFRRLDVPSRNELLELMQTWLEGDQL